MGRAAVLLLVVAVALSGSLVVGSTSLGSAVPPPTVAVVASPRELVAPDAVSQPYVPGSWASAGSFPPGRSAAAMAEDGAAHLLVLFGGADALGVDRNDTWTYDAASNAWTNESPAVHPSARDSAAIAYDAAADRIFLFGGASAAGDLNDTWSYDLAANAWTNITGPVAPPARDSAGTSYDAGADRLILFGGQSSSGALLQDTWALNPTTNAWTQLRPAASPSARSEMAMTYDAASAGSLLFGGRGGTNDTWIFDYAADTWTDRTVGPAPPARLGAAIAYDGALGLAVLYGGFGTAYRADTWTYDASVNRWTNVTSVIAPSSRAGTSLAYDGTRGRVVLFGGFHSPNVLGDIWSLDVAAATWTAVDPGFPPPAREYPAATFDSRSGETLVFGGDSGSGGRLFGDTWAYRFEAATWTNLSRPTGPPARTYAGLAYDPAADRSFLFGGSDATFTAFRNDTWSYDRTADVWTNLSSTVAPSPRSGMGLAYDASADRVVLFGGLAASGYMNDTWSYNPATDRWTNVSSTGSPSPRGWAGMTYDASARRIVLFGGFDASSYFNDTWVYNATANAWTNVSGIVAPSPRYDPAIASDAGAGRIFLFGGSGSGGDSIDTWSFDPTADAWTQVQPGYAVITPPGRTGHILVYDSVAGRSILFSGTTGLSVLNDTWSFQANATIWTSLRRDVRPQAETDNPMVYDAAADRFVLFVNNPQFGPLALTWTYDLAAHVWMNVSNGIAPSERDTNLVYDSARGRLLLFGGEAATGFLNDTWSYDLSTDSWTALSATGAPSPRVLFGLAYDSAADRVVLFGGHHTGAYLNDTWIYDPLTNAWTEAAPNVVPSPRDANTMVYDAAADRVLLFGGYTTADYNDTWSYDLSTNAWTSLSPAVSPPARRRASMTYDSREGRALLFGGNGDVAPYTLGDTWAYSAVGNTWLNLTSPASPPPRRGASLAYSPAADRTLLFGGSLGGSVFLDLWWYAYATAPTAARALQATPGDGRVTLSWSPPAVTGGPAVTAYRVYRGTSPGGESPLTTAGPGLSYTDTAVTNNVTYYYEVAAVNAIGVGPPSNEASATPAPPADTVPPKIVIVSPSSGASLTTTQVTVTGTASDNVAVAKVELSLDGSLWTPATGTTVWFGNLTLAAGSDVIHARATDLWGNTATTNVTVSVAGPGGGPGSPSGGLADWALPLAIVAVVIAAGAVAAWFLLVRRRRDGDDGRGPKDPQG